MYNYIHGVKQITKGNKMKNLVYSAYARSPKTQNAKISRFLTLELLASFLSIVSYSLIVSQNYMYGYFIGFLASLILAKIMLKKDAFLTGLYLFFIVANLTGFLQFFTI